METRDSYEEMLNEKTRREPSREKNGEEEEEKKGDEVGRER